MMAIDTQRLRELIRAYYNLTHIRVAVYNPDFEEILAYPEEYTPFCHMLQSNEAREPQLTSPCLATRKATIGRSSHT